jgi:Tol biopolymer transport system component
VSVGADGAQANGSSQFPSISGDGNRIAFQSGATNHTTDDTLGKSQIFVRDIAAETTTLVSKSSGVAGNDHSSFASISENGRYVAFQSRASNLSSLDADPYPDGREDIYVVDLNTGVTTLVSLGASGKGNGDSGGASISADGSAVVFESNSTNLVSGVTGGQIYLRAGGTTTLVSKNTTTGEQGNGVSYDPHISPNGR